MVSCIVRERNVGVSGGWGRVEGVRGDSRDMRTRCGSHERTGFVDMSVLSLHTTHRPRSVSQGLVIALVNFNLGDRMFRPSLFSMHPPTLVRYLR